MPEFDIDAALRVAPNSSAAYTIDLKWCVWSCHRPTWDDAAPEVWAVLNGLQPNEEAEIVSAPSDIYKYARILISRSGDGTWFADGTMEEQWDAAGDLLGTFNLPDDAYDWFLTILPYASGEVGVLTTVYKTAGTLQRLMEAVDQAETNLIGRSETEFATVRNFAEAWLKDH